MQALRSDLIPQCNFPFQTNERNVVQFSLRGASRLRASSRGGNVSISCWAQSQHVTGVLCAHPRVPEQWCGEHRKCLSRGRRPPEWTRYLRPDWLSNSRQNTEKCFLVERVPFPGRVPVQWWSLAQGPAPRREGVRSRCLAFGVEGTVCRGSRPYACVREFCQHLFV